MSDTGNAFDKWMTDYLHNGKGTYTLEEFFAMHAETEDTNANETGDN